MADMNEIYRQHARTVYGFLLTRTGDARLAEELTQETFYQAIRSIGRFEGNCSISTWLCAIAGNVWREYAKKAKKDHDVSKEAAVQNAYAPSAEDSVIADWQQQRVMACIHRLKEPMREVMYLRLSGNLSFAQIGEIMGRTENWARVTFYRGKEKIIREVQHDESE
ncbi:MAG: RNA polymerase sigma factor [Emergencia sp.]